MQNTADKVPYSNGGDFISIYVERKIRFFFRTKKLIWICQSYANLFLTTQKVNTCLLDANLEIRIKYVRVCVWIPIHYFEPLF